MAEVTLELPDLATLAPRALGFRVREFAALQQWKPLAIDDGVPMTEVPACPADGATLRVLCTLTGSTTRRRVRIGCCPQCGHVTYIDRPTSDWIEQYYLSTWDAKDVEQRSVRRQTKLAVRLPGPKTGVKIALGLDVDRRRPVCEIGCGYGANLKHLSVAGFERVVGTEASAHRARVARDAFGFSVFTAPFESSATQRALAAFQPFSIIYSHHVLEHTYHPDEVIAAASRLQADGDYLIISVPHHALEPSLGVLLFLPHLHSFTRTSLERLAARYGYELFDDAFTHPKNLNLVFRRTAAATAAPAPARPFEAAVAKYIRSLDLGHRRFWRRRLWWNRRADQAGQVWTPAPRVLERRYWAWLARRHDWVLHRSMLVSDLGARRTSVAESPLEIQFPGDVVLLYK